ncbi:hypothetical protein [Finegoldia sp. BIOML-A1]|uniref:hypothetical protein n=1 Tax=Finegoldia sp. BIOML-A1 TaxID=2584649 RepID=UPI0012AF95E4|nr:hypothetical protein [Finegoldia sp. BIOML-A1]MSB11343.1 hypothetical protein [Finegoldia sp. BIOML-A1]
MYLTSPVVLSTVAPVGASLPRVNSTPSGFVVPWPPTSLKFGAFTVASVPGVPLASVYSGW